MLQLLGKKEKKRETGDSGKHSQSLATNLSLSLFHTHYSKSNDERAKPIHRQTDRQKRANKLSSDANDEFGGSDAGRRKGRRERDAK